MQKNKRLMRAVLSVGLGAMLASVSAPAWGQTAPPTAPVGPQPQSAQPEFKWPDFAAMTKDMQPHSGLFTVFQYNRNDPTKDHSKILAEIPRGLMKQDLLLAISGSRGQQAGFQLDDYLIRFEIVGRRVMITVPDMRYVQKPGDPVTDAINRTYTSRFLASMPILTMSPGGNPVVDLGQVILGPPIGMSVGFGAMPRRDMSEVTKIKMFPDNGLIDVDLAIASPTGSGQSIGLTYAFRRLPQIGEYRPRVADERVGYFTTVRQDWSIKHHERENIIRYINRWDVKKKDPSLELSPPDKPIVFVIEKTVPLQWRRWVKEGIEEWNKSYEQIGIVGAIVVQQQTEDNEFANVDPEDARYNFIRWIVTGRAFAMGPSRADPRTGQILDADIIFDDSMLRFYFEDFQTFGPQPVASMMGPEVATFLAENPGFIPAGETREQVHQAVLASQGELLADAPSGSAETFLRSTRINPRKAMAACNYADGLRHQVSMTAMAIVAAEKPTTLPTQPAGKKKMPEKFIGEVIKQIISHEVGHTLGLRHNFKASSWLSLEEIKRRRDTSNEPTVASVMDYNPVLFFAGDEPEKMNHFITPTVGPYDHWAIEYGYKQPGQGDGDEKTMLGKIAQQNTKRELAYATDEDTMGLSSPDPLVNRYDMGEDPVAWAKMRVTLADALLKDMKKWAIKGDEPNHWLRNTFMTVMYEKSRNMMYVSRIVGGQSFNRNRSGDPNARPAFELLEPKRQREALNSLSETIFHDDFFAIEAELLNDLAPSRWWDWASNPMSRVDFPAHQTISSMRAYALLNLCSPQVIQRVYDAELKSKADDKFTAAELVSGVRNMVWSNLTLGDDVRFTDSKPMLSSLQRNLQRQHLQYQLAIVDSDPGSLVSPDLQSTVRFSLRELSGQIGALIEKSKINGSAESRLDFGTRAHLTECKSQIDRVLDAPYIKMPEMRMSIMSSYHGQDAQRQQQMMMQNQQNQMQQP